MVVLNILFSIILTFLIIRNLQCRYLLKGHGGRVAAIVWPSFQLPSIDVSATDKGGTLIASCGLDRRVLLWDTSSASSPAPLADSAVEIAMVDAMAKKLKNSSSDSRRGSRGEAGEDIRGSDPQQPLAVEPCMLYASGLYRGAEEAVRSAAGPLVGLCVSPSPCPTPLSKQKDKEDAHRHQAGSFVLAAASAGQFIACYVMMHVTNSRVLLLHA